MKVLDLFSGLAGWSEPFKERGHETFTIDIEESFNPDLAIDILALYPSMLPWKPDIILASPPCETFSVMTIGRNWTIDHQPKTEKAKLHLQLVYKTFDLIEDLSPIFWVVENPRAKMRRIVDLNYPWAERRTVTYCQYGEKFMKPTDLWGGFPASLVLNPPCKNGAPCHTPAARGSITGIQGTSRTKFKSATDEYENMLTTGQVPLSQSGKRFSAFGDSMYLQAMYWSHDPRRAEISALRAKIPHALALQVCEAAERDYEISINR